MTAARRDGLRVLAALARHARERPDDVAVSGLEPSTTGRLRMTFAELAASTSHVAAALRRELAPDAVVIVCLPNSCEYVAAFLGTLAAGMTVFPIAPSLCATERRDLAARSRAAAWIGEVPPPDPGPGAAGLRVFDPAELTRPAAETPGPARSDRGGDGALYLPSSGTTGPPKIVRRTGATLDAVADNVVAATGLGPRDVVLVAIPMCHSYGVENGVLAPVLAGSRIVAACGVDVAAMHDQLDRGATVFPGVPFMYEALVETALARAPRALRLAYSAGSRMPPAVARAFAALSGTPAGQLYGSTEVGSVTFDHPAAPGFDPRTVGRPLAGVDLRILAIDDPDPARPLPPDTEGQVAIAAPSMLDAYVDADESPLLDGFFLMGDLGRLGRDGRLTIQGRLKLQIDVAGQKVNPMEVERVLAGHPGVGECVVVPLPVSETVNRLKAIVVPNPDAPPVDAAGLRAFVREQLSTHKVPRVIEIRSALPRTASGKIILRGDGP